VLDKELFSIVKAALLLQRKRLKERGFRIQKGEA
jgi:hypothetical protein